MTGAGGESAADGTQHAEVPAELDGARLDAAAARLFPSWSRARLQAWIEQGLLTRNGAAAARAREPVRTGDRLELRPRAERSDQALAQDIGLDVVYADASVRQYPYLYSTGGFTDDATFQLLWCYNRVTVIDPPY